MKRSFLIALIIAGFMLPVSGVLAEESPAEKVIQGVKDSVGALIDAKDKNDPKETQARLDAYEKVLALATADTKELKLKLLTYEGDKDRPTTTVALWKKNRIEFLNAALKRYENEERGLDEMETPSLEGIKTQAETLKKWREETYLPVAEEIQAFLLIETQKKSLETANARLEKVGTDVNKLKTAKFKEIKLMEEKYSIAKDAVADSAKANGIADRNFQKYYLLPFMGKSDPQRIAFQKEIDAEKKELKDTDASSTSSASPSANRGESYPPSPSSIKDLVDESFRKVKDAYRIFIEMSDLVRRSL